MPADEEAQRAIAFMQAIEQRTATRKEPWSLGTAFFNSDFPIKYDYNYLRIERDDPTLDVARIAQEADSLQNSAGLIHRKVTADDGRIGARLAPGFRRSGWNVSRLVIMVHRGRVPDPGPVPVRETDFDELRVHFVRSDVEERKMKIDEAEMLADSMRIVEQTCDWRLFVGTIGDQVAGWCELFTENGVGQVENVGTYSRHRDQGVARSVIVRALEESSKAGNDMHFLVADDDDWPKELYARLGFEPVGYLYEFLLTPSKG